MQNKSEDTSNARREEMEEREDDSTLNKGYGPISHWMQNLLHLGLGEFLLRAATNIFSAIAILIVIWLAQMFFRQPVALNQGNAEAAATPQSMPPAAALASNLPLDLSSLGIVRQANIHTSVPERAREDVVKYTVQAGDTVSDIAQNFGLQPISIFAANYALLEDDPENLKPGQQLVILPVDGVYRQWFPGEKISTVATYYQVSAQDIIDYPANHLDPNTTDIPAGTMIIIPGGVYQYHTPGQVPLGITRSNPASAQVGGDGACAPVTGGAVGTGTFVYPTDRHYLSGFDYSVKTNHLAIDLAANLGDNIYAADGGVIVYAGSNSYGYGNMVMIDHGTGFQTLYAHLSQIFVTCGQNVTQGQVIGAAGATGHATGPHLHFEVRTATAVIDPWDVLPPPSAAPQ
jgi:murein DD-endopeptidase MepM/ murein hydrolase activator NlpD